MLTSLTGDVRGKHPFVDLALGAESHIKRHLVHLADAKARILSYMECGDLSSINQAIDAGLREQLGGTRDLAPGGDEGEVLVLGGAHDALKSLPASQIITGPQPRGKRFGHGYTVA